MKNHFLLLLCIVFAAGANAQKTRTVHFSWGMEVLPANFNSISQEYKLQAPELVLGKYVRYIQFEKTLNADERNSIKAMGIDMLGYVYPATYLLLLPGNTDIQRLERFSALSVVAIAPVWKMSKSLREPPFGQWAVHGDWIDINLQAYPHVGIQDAARRCRENGMIVLKEGTQNGFVQVRMLKEELMVNAALPFIQYMELVPPPGEKEDTRGRALHRSNALDTDYPTGKKYNGDGVRTLVRDDGQLGPHIDFQGRLYNRAAGQPGSGTHGDGVGGIIAGAGNLDPSKKGMAAGADVFTLDYVNSFQDETLPLHLNEGVTITNSSYSDGCNVGYTLATQTVDMQLFEHPTLMHVFSAGNSNGANCGYGAGNQWGNVTGGHKMAKNSIATANLLQNATLDGTSSRGPAYDGRLKPDIAANGTNHFSTNPFNTYQEFGGTSAAAPGIAGCLAQLTQAYKAINAAQEPNATLLKATILNTANDLGNIGPDFKFGWGHINARRALSLLEEHRHLTAQVDQGMENMHALPVPAGTKQARVMVVWADPPADPDAARALLNDLDISIVSPDGATTYLPWKLDPTPDETILDTPAGTGRDSLNNVEQVAINDPIAGNYTIHINGTDVPFGPQEYQLVWEFVQDDIKLTYPGGGEGFEAGDVVRIHWDAWDTGTNFTLRLSLDGGATFSAITTVSGDKRMYDWTVPSLTSGNAKLLLIKGGKRDTMDYPFTLAPIPKNLEVTKVCPDSMTVAWTEINDTLSYDVYLLGTKYMEIIGTADTNQYSFPISNAALPQWIAVRTSHANGITSRRTIAINWQGELKNCPQDVDLGVRKLLNPGADTIVSCSATTQAVAVRVFNEGLNSISGAQINYQAGNDPIVSEALPDIMPGDSVDFTFLTPFAISTNGYVNLKIWSDGLVADVSNFNDTISYQILVITQAVSGIFKESFEASSDPPDGWIVSNPDNDISWELSNPFPNLIGIDGNPTRAFYLNHYQYSEEGELDYLYMIPVDLINVTHPGLGFDLAHRRYDNTYTDGLRIELFPNCDLSADPVVIYEIFDPELSTVGNGTAYYIPADANDWRRQSIDLEAYAGQTAVIRFVSINGYGNTTFIDNIGIEEYAPPVLPIAEFLNVPDTICRQDTVVFTANQVTPSAQYAWRFDPPASPVSATGPGPHAVYFPSYGNKTIRLIATNVVGADTAFYDLVVLPFPSANFTQNASNLTVTFNNSSSNATSYSWEFGDGNMSTEADPVHSYAAPGTYTYTVTLTSENQCKTATKSVTITLTSKVSDLADQMDISILPNPTSGDFMVKIESRRSEEMQFSLLDAQGRLVKTINRSVNQGLTNIAFEGLKLPKGIYQLNLLSESGQATFSIVVQ